MASNKISELSSATSLNSTDQIVVNNSGVTKRTALSKIANWVLGIFTPSVGGSEQTVISAIDSTTATANTANSTANNALSVANAASDDSATTFTSGDAASPSSWTAVDVITSGITRKTLYNRLSTMVKNVRFLWGLIGSTNFSSSGKSTITSLLGNTQLTQYGDGTLTGVLAANAKTMGSTSISSIGDGTVTGAISSLNNDLANIGVVAYGTTTGSVTLNNETRTILGSITLPEGIWVVVYCADWAPNVNGYRQIMFISAVNPERNAAVTSRASDSTYKQDYQQLVQITEGNRTLTLYGLHNSGSALTVYPYIYAVRIK